MFLTRLFSRVPRTERKFRDKIKEDFFDRQRELDYAPVLPDTELTGERGTYRVIKLIFRGGMANIYEVQDIKTNKRYVAKVTNHTNAEKDFVKYLYQEGRVLAYLTDPRIVKITDVGFYHGQGPFIVIELIPGNNLAKVIQKRKLTPFEARKIGLGVCEGFENVHNTGIISRDPTTNNVIVRDNLDIVLIDFGLAKFVDEKLNDLPKRDAESKGYAPKIIPGTLAFMAPEQIWAEPSDFRSDIYGIGVILYTMITGFSPFEGTPFNKINQMPQAPIELVSIHGSLNEIIMTALAIDPEDRFQSIKELKKSLRRSKT